MFRALVRNQGSHVRRMSCFYSKRTSRTITSRSQPSSIATISVRQSDRSRYSVVCFRQACRRYVTRLGSQHNGPVMVKYMEEVNSGKLKSDPVQEEVVTLLDDLCLKVSAYTPPNWPEEEILEVEITEDEYGRDPNTDGPNAEQPISPPVDLARNMASGYQREDMNPEALKIAMGRLRLLNSNGERVRAVDRGDVTRKEDGKLYRRIVRLAKVDHEAPRGLYIHGEVGTGKTMLMDLFYNTVPVKRKRRIHFHQFMRQFFAEFHRWQMQGRGHSGVMGPVVDIAEWLMEDAWLICFDEIQVTDVASARILGDLFQLLIDHGCVVVATSNRHPSELYSGGFQRDIMDPFIKLLQQRCDIHQVTSETDYRRVKYSESNKKAGGKMQQVYFKSKDVDDVAAFERFWLNTVTEHKHKDTTGEVSEDHVIVHGRKVTIPMSCGGVARFSFQELCVQPLGTADYFEICNQYHTIFLEEIPRLALPQRNELRRFINLIDAAYENKTKVIFLAESEPERILDLHRTSEEQGNVDGDVAAERTMHMEMMGEMMYDLKTSADLQTLSMFTGEDEVFAVRRAISRIREMQSHDYMLHHHKPLLFTMRLRENKPADETYSGPSIGGKANLAQHGGQSVHAQRESGMSDDFADEASYREEALDQIRVQRKRSVCDRGKLAPSFTPHHFFGHGWWESIKEKLAAKAGIEGQNGRKPR
eukprot:Clim_evm8s217 gene=Clim_evmTU8s217